MKMPRIVVLSMLFALVSACDRSAEVRVTDSAEASVVNIAEADAREVQGAVVEPEKWDGEWYISGALREVNLHGRINATTTLKDFMVGPSNAPNHALGSIGGLRGEYTIWDDAIALAHGGESPKFAITTLENLSDELSATFIFGTYVAQWTELETPEAFDLEQLSDFLEAHVGSHGVHGAMPFRVQGTLEKIHAHVVDENSLPEGGGSSCGERKKHAYNFGGERLEGRIVGIFTTSHTSIIVDHTTYIHAHVILDDQRSGHIDELVLPAGTKILVPKQI